ncbi:uncharacterized protein LOC110815909 [Carica papaya]|uniref:uncharacterized protein LOC110815909 n=1 Tax=Carica papaya TaxID=3649 RepID=UPI000B8CEFFF|nr:uncharacterized protein LOC110815909 [Carica papaya]
MIRNSMSLKKKLKPAQIAWRSFTTKLQSTLHVPTTIKSKTHRLLKFFSHHLFIPFKKRFLIAKASIHGRRHRGYPNQHRYYKHTDQNKLAAIYIDQLYAETETSRSGKAEVDDGDENKSVHNSIEDAWNAIVASSPHLRGVDERAEEFIFKFREDMRLQKERSYLEFQEMLARSA